MGTFQKLNQQKNPRQDGKPCTGEAEEHESCSATASCDASASATDSTDCTWENWQDGGCGVKGVGS